MRTTLASPVTVFQRTQSKPPYNEYKSSAVSKFVDFDSHFSPHLALHWQSTEQQHGLTL